MVILFSLTLMGAIVATVVYIIYRSFSSAKNIEAWTAEIEAAEAEESTNLPEQGTAQTDTTQTRLVNRADVEAILVDIKSVLVNTVGQEIDTINACSPINDFHSFLLDNMKKSSHAILTDKINLLDLALEEIRTL